MIGYGVIRSAVRALLDSGESRDRIVVVAYDEDSTREANELGVAAGCKVMPAASRCSPRPASAGPSGW